MSRARKLETTPVKTKYVFVKRHTEQQEIAVVWALIDANEPFATITIPVHIPDPELKAAKVDLQDAISMWVSFELGMMS
jgi:hypothetical protein